MLFAVEGSASVAEAVADAVKVPADWGLTTTVKVSRAPVARSPSGIVNLPSLASRRQWPKRMSHRPGEIRSAWRSMPTPAPGWSP